MESVLRLVNLCIFCNYCCKGCSNFNTQNVIIFSGCVRYGLPVNFQAMLLYPHKKNTKRLRDVLNQLYGHLDSSAVQSSGAHDVRIVCNIVVKESRSCHWT